MGEGHAVVSHSTRRGEAECRNFLAELYFFLSMEI